MDCEGESPSNERDVMESVVNSLIEDSEQNIDLEEYVNEGVEECNLTKSYPCGLCSKVCKSKGGLTYLTFESKAWRKNGRYKDGFAFDFGGR